MSGTPDDDSRAARLAWANAEIARGRAVGPLPTFGSAEWEALPTDDPRSWAAVVMAAELWVEVDR